MANFCTACGCKLGDTSISFCPQCGQNLKGKKPAYEAVVSNDNTSADTKLPADASLKSRTSSVGNSDLPKKKIKSSWVVAGVALTVFLAIMAYVAYEDYIYPKSQAAIEKLLLNRHWLTKEATLLEVYIDGKKINKPGSSIKQSIQDAVEGNAYGQIYSLVEEQLKSSVEKENFIWVSKMKEGGLFFFDMNYDQNLNEPTYITYKPKLEFNSASSRFVLNCPADSYNSSSMSSGAWTEDDPTEIKNYKIEISKITETTMSLKTDITIVMNGKDYRFITEQVSKPYVPIASFIKRVEQESEIAEIPEDFDY
jgi:hypothetical protein